MSEVAAAAVPAAPRTKAKISRDDWTMRGCMVGIGLFLAVFVLLPLYTLLSKSFENRAGEFIGLANFAEYFETPALFLSAINSLYISVIGTMLVLGTAFVYAYAPPRAVPIYRMRSPSPGGSTLITWAP